MFELAGELRDPEMLDRVLNLATGDESKSSTAAILTAAFAVLAHSDDDRVAGRILSAYPTRDQAWRARAIELLLSRGSWAKMYLESIDRGRLPAADLTLEQIRMFPALKEPALAALIRKHWGVQRGATPEERLAEVRRLNNDLNAAPGNADRGRLLFRDRCASCHRLGELGESIGPDLTFANRQDRHFLLTSLVDPSGTVRKEYQLYQIETRDGRVFSGLITEQTPVAITLRDNKGGRTSILQSEVAELKESEGSLMPDSLYREFRPEELRDLFSFLQSDRTATRKVTP